MIRISNININYKEKVVIEDSNIDIASGQVTLIYGDSGCGKSSLLYYIGLFVDIKGEYYLNDMAIHYEDTRTIANIRRTEIGYVFQNHVIFKQYNVKDNILFYASLVNFVPTEEEIANLLHSLKLPSSILLQNVETLSGGERQRLAIACVLIKKPSIIILDEPTSALDKENERIVLEIIRDIAHDLNKTVIVVSHSSAAIEYSDTIYTINEKKIVLSKGNIEKSDVPIKNEKSILPKKFLCNYAIDQLYRLKKSSIILVLSLIVSLLGGFITSQATEVMSLQQQDKIVALSSNQVFIGGIAANYLEEELFSGMEEISDYYPYIPMQLEINGNWYTVQPYFHEEEIKDKVASHITYEKGIYISSFIVHELSNSINGKTSIVSNISIVTKNEIKTIEDTITISGYLKNGVVSPYDKSDKYYVYMPYEMIHSYYQQVSKSDSFIGYTIFTSTFEQLQTLQKKFGNSDELIYNDGFQNIKTIQSSLENVQNTKIMINITVDIILVAQYIFIRYWLLQQRKNEFALLLVNGLDNKQIKSVVIYENILQLLIAILISSILIIIISFFVNIQNISFIIVGLEILFLILILPWVYNYYLKSMNIIKIIRH